MSEQFHFFYKSPLSQWHMVNFIVDDIIFCCAEQYMMYSKAILFNDKETASLILKTKIPSEHKALGRKVKNFYQDVWDKNAGKIVFKGNYERFKQNDDQWEVLKNTGTTTIVEANPWDTIWAIGLSKDDPRCLQRETWKGKNWLGQALTAVRNKLIKEKL